MKRTTNDHLAGLLASASLILPLAAHAQSAKVAAPPSSGAGSSSSSVVGEVIVTAQRRAQSLEKTALTIQVVQQKALATAGITSPLQLSTLLPNFQVGAAGPFPSVYVRGVGGYSSTAQSNPAIPFYIDGVYVARSQSVPSEFYDIERVEALIGPQGTLYGRNASGGALNVLTHQPVLGKYAASGMVELGNYKDRTGELAINLPLGDTLALRLSGDITDKGGYTSEKFGDDVHQSGRGKLLWKPNDDVSLLLNVSGGHIGGLNPAFVLLNKNVPGWYPWLDGSSPQAQNLIKTTGVPGLVSPATPNEARQDLNFFNASAQLDWNLGFGTLSVIPAYRRASMRYNALFTFEFLDGGGFGVYPDRPETSDQTSLEVRLGGDTKKLKWVAGLYFFNEDQFSQYQSFDGLIANLGYISNLGTTSYAAFGQTTYSINDHFRLIGGLRYTIDQRSLTNGISYFVNPTVLGPNGVPCSVIAPTAPACVSDRFSGNKTFNNFSWKGGFEADVLEDSLLYATASRGFKAGGFNTQSGPVAGQALGFAPEILTSYELGLKNRFLQNRLQLNINGFYWDYDNHQESKVAVTTEGSVDQVFVNAGAAKIYGGDLDVIARPWSGGTINVGVEYAHSKYDSFSYTQPVAFTATGCPTTPTGAVDPHYGPVVTVNCAGYQVSHVPEWSGTVGVAQDFQFGSSRLTASANTTFATARWLGAEFTALERAGAYALFNASLTYQHAGSPWTATAFVRNLNNGRDYTFAFPSPVSAAVVSNIGPPRTYGGQISVSF